MMYFYNLSYNFEPQSMFCFGCFRLGTGNTGIILSGILSDMGDIDRFDETMLKKGVKYDPEKMMQDIKLPVTGQTSAA